MPVGVLLPLLGLTDRGREWDRTPSITSALGAPEEEGSVPVAAPSGEAGYPGLTLFSPPPAWAPTGQATRTQSQWCLEESCWPAAWVRALGEGGRGMGLASKVGPRWWRSMGCLGLAITNCPGPPPWISCPGTALLLLPRKSPEEQTGVHPAYTPATALP